MDMLFNFKEFKNLTLNKFLSGSLFISIVIYLTDFFYPDVYLGFVQAMKYFAKKIEFNAWAGIIPVCKIVIEASLYLSILILLFLFISRMTIWSEFKQQSLSYTLIEQLFMLNLNITFFSVLSYLNIILFYRILGAEWKGTIHSVVVCCVCLFLYILFWFWRINSLSEINDENLSTHN